jgi:hypothetical protein
LRAGGSRDLPGRHVAAGIPTTFLNARLNAASMRSRTRDARVLDANGNAPRYLCVGIRI